MKIISISTIPTHLFTLVSFMPQEKNGHQAQINIMKKLQMHKITSARQDDALRVFLMSLVIKIIKLPYESMHFGIISPNSCNPLNIDLRFQSIFLGERNSGLPASSSQINDLVELQNRLENKVSNISCVKLFLYQQECKIILQRHAPQKKTADNSSPFGQVSAYLLNIMKGNPQKYIFYSIFFPKESCLVN